MTPRAKVERQLTNRIIEDDNLLGWSRKSSCRAARQQPGIKPSVSCVGPQTHAAWRKPNRTPPRFWKDTNNNSCLPATTLDELTFSSRPPFSSSSCSPKLRYSVTSHRWHTFFWSLSRSAWTGLLSSPPPPSTNMSAASQEMNKIEICFLKFLNNFFN